MEIEFKTERRLLIMSKHYITNLPWREIKDKNPDRLATLEILHLKSIHFSYLSYLH